MRKTYFSEIRRDEASGRLNVIQYQYEPPESGEGAGKFFEVRFRPRLPWRQVVAIGTYLLALAGVELVMAEDNVKVGVGLLALVVGGFLAIISFRGFTVEPGRKVSDRILEDAPIPVEAAEKEEIQELIEPSGPQEELLYSILKRALEGQRDHLAKAQQINKSAAMLRAAVITLTVVAGIASVFAAVNVYDREIFAVIAAASAGSAALAEVAQRRLQYDIRAERHMQAATELEAMLQEITQLRLREMDRDIFFRLVVELDEFTERSQRLSED